MKTIFKVFLHQINELFLSNNIQLTAFCGQLELKPVGPEETKYFSMISEKIALSEKSKLLFLTPRSQVENRKQFWHKINH